MPTARDKLIAEWHDRLAAAEAVDTSSPSRPAWLARLQIRLYRFLLSLYGAGDWTTTPPRRSAPKSRAHDGDDSVVFDSPSALPLAGKPAKSIGQIQSVLKSVANAQTSAPAAGPLANGLTAESWVTIQLVRPKRLPQVSRSRQTLYREGIDTRLQRRGNCYSLEVRAWDRQRAAELLQAARDEEARRAQQLSVPFRPLPRPAARTTPSPYSGHALVIGLAIGPLAGYLAALWFQNVHMQTSARNDGMTWVLLVLFWAGTAALTCLAFAAVAPIIAAVPDMLRRARSRRHRFATRTSTRGRFWAEYAWHCLTVGVLIGPFVGLVCVAAAGNIPSPERSLIFFLGWWSTIAVATLIYLIPPLRWLIPWLE